MLGKEQGKSNASEPNLNPLDSNGSDDKLTSGSNVPKNQGINGANCRDSNTGSMGEGCFDSEPTNGNDKNANPPPECVDQGNSDTNNQSSSNSDINPCFENQDVQNETEQQTANQTTPCPTDNITTSASNNNTNTNNSSNSNANTNGCEMFPEVEGDKANTNTLQGEPVNRNVKIIGEITDVGGGEEPEMFIVPESGVMGQFNELTKPVINERNAGANVRKAVVTFDTFYDPSQRIDIKYSDAKHDKTVEKAIKVSNEVMGK